MKCLQIWNQRRTFYVNVENGISECDLAFLWIGLSEIGYFKICKSFVELNPSDFSSYNYFDSLQSFKHSLGVKRGV